jgi:hypothetical protein
MREKFQGAGIRVFVSIISFLFVGPVFLVTDVFAGQITILYTGQTHAMIYPCHCPKDPAGGVSRRATLINQMRKKYRSVLLLDSGGFFAGGLLDEYTQNTQLDMRRSDLNLSSMKLMGYDAVNIGESEFNFGWEHLLKLTQETGLNFLTCNVQTPNFLPSMIKELDGIKFGIIGVTSPAANQKAKELKFIKPKIAVAGKIAELKAQGAQIIILLSNLEEPENINLINDAKGIDILIGGLSRRKEESFSKLGETLLLRPSWQGRSLGVAVLTIKDYKIADSKVENVLLSDKISDDLQVVSLLPKCFSDFDCKKADLFGECLSPGLENASCQFAKPNTVNLKVITAKECRSCETEQTVNFLKKWFPGTSVSYLYYTDKAAKKIVSELGINSLPIFLLGSEVEKEKNFDNFKPYLAKKGQYYLLKPEFGGVGYFINRKRIKGQLDLFFSLYEKNSQGLLESIREYKPKLHFLALEEKDKFEAAKGMGEVEEYLRCICMEKYYPNLFWDYIICRTKNIESSWWEDCLVDSNAAAKVKTCAKGPEGKLLLRDNIKLNKEIQVMFGPIYLLDNQDIFGTAGEPSKEELKRILKR